MSAYAMLMLLMLRGFHENYLIHGWVACQPIKDQITALNFYIYFSEPQKTHQLNTNRPRAPQLPTSNDMAI